MDIILHHYPQSPFAEKIRLMLGYCDKRWLSLPSPPKPPRPNVDPLTGGYRRIPVAQLGADIFCDTRIIASEIALLENKPALAVENCSSEVIEFCSRSESQVFIASFSAIPARLALPAVLKQFSLWQLPGFMLDRVKMTRGSDFKLMPLFEAQQVVLNHLVEMEARLEDKFLFGAEPCLADFATYPTFWMLNQIAPELIPAELSKVTDWLARMKRFGHGHPHEVRRKLAFELAESCQPRNIAPHWQSSATIGRQVSISPADYAKRPVKGELVGENEDRWILLRQTKAFGSLHVHFPKQGYQIEES